MAAYRQVYGFSHLRSDCRGPELAPKPYAHFEYGTTFIVIITSGQLTLTSGRWQRGGHRSTASDRRLCRTVDDVGGLITGRRRGTAAGDVSLLTDTPAVVRRQEPVGVAVAAAVRELTTAGRRHVVEVAPFRRPAWPRLRSQPADFYIMMSSSGRLELL